MALLQAKRAMEELLDTDLAQAGIAAAPVQPSRSIDVRALRHRLGLGCEQFALGRNYCQFIQY